MKQNIVVVTKFAAVICGIFSAECRIKIEHL